MRYAIWLGGPALCAILCTPALAQQTLTGKIKSFECGDNCYLTIRTDQGRDETALCAAKACDPWNEVADMPKSVVGRAVRVTLGTRTQVDGGGNRMGRMKSFRTMTFVDGTSPSPTAGMRMFNIYASVKDSDSQYPAKTTDLQRKLRACGVETQSDFTYNFQQMTQGLVIVYSGPYPSAAAASAHLEKAKACGVNGFGKLSRRTGGE